MDVRTEPVIVAEGPHVRLRPKRAEDAPDDYRWRTDPELARLDGAEPRKLTWEQFLDWYEAEVLTPRPDRRTLAIETREGRHIGSLMYYNVAARLDAAEVGILIGEREYWGCGFGTEALIAFLRYAWSNHPWRRLVLHTLDWNERAQRSFLKAGFRPVGFVSRGEQRFLRMETERAWWLLWESEGRFAPWT